MLMLFVQTNGDCGEADVVVVDDVGNVNRISLAKKQEISTLENKLKAQTNQSNQQPELVRLLTMYNVDCEVISIIVNMF